MRLAFLYVGVLGLEPRMTGPESVVLPLHHTPKLRKQVPLVFADAKVALFYLLAKKKSTFF